MRTSTASILGALLLTLSACGGGPTIQDPPATATTGTSAAAVPVPSANATLETPRGTPVPEALSRFTCAEDTKGGWRATGRLANSGKAKVTFQVTVYIGEADGTPGPASTQQVADVAPGGMIRFAIDDIPAPKAGGPCYIQVLKTK